MSIRLALALITTVTMLSACETMGGLGRDTQKLGSSITRAAQ